MLPLEGGKRLERRGGEGCGRWGCGGHRIVHGLGKLGPKTSTNLSLSSVLLNRREERIQSCQEAFMAIGVLALQGSFNEHITALNKIGVKGVEIRKPEQLEHVRALIIPGGESTTMAKLAEYHNLFPALRTFIKSGKPVWGTCAGLIFLADRAVGQKLGGQELVGGLDCVVHRNFFGSQLQSFETELSVPTLAEKEGGAPNFRGIFIRAPAILEVGPSVEILSDFPVPSKVAKAAGSESKTEQEQNWNGEKVIVAVKQGNLLATAFHPELTSDTRWHSFFLKMGDGDVEQGSVDQNIAYISKQLPVFQ